MKPLDYYHTHKHRYKTNKLLRLNLKQDTPIKIQVSKEILDLKSRIVMKFIQSGK